MLVGPLPVPVTVEMGVPRVVVVPSSTRLPPVAVVVAFGGDTGNDKVWPSVVAALPPGVRVSLPITRLVGFPKRVRVPRV